MLLAFIVLVQVSWQEGFTRLHEFLYCLAHTFKQKLDIKPWEISAF